MCFAVDMLRRGWQCRAGVMALGGCCNGVGMGWVVALGAGMLQKLWEWGGVCGSWWCRMGAPWGLWVQGEMLWCAVAAWGDGGVEPQVSRTDCYLPHGVSSVQGPASK